MQTARALVCSAALACGLSGIGAGGVEKNGPSTATDKHNYTLKTTLDVIARLHGKALVAF
jgi:hypothetical protein